MPSINAASKPKAAAPTRADKSKTSGELKIGGQLGELFRKDLDSASDSTAGSTADATGSTATVAKESSASSSPADFPATTSTPTSAPAPVAPAEPAGDREPSQPPVPVAAVAPPTTIQPQAPTLGAAAARAAAAQEQAPVPAEKAPMTSLSLYPPEGTAAAFKALARELGITYGALAIKAVTDHLGALETQMGPQAVVVAGYAPRNTVKVDRQSIVLRVTLSDAQSLQQLADSWPGCRSRNHLLSTAVSMLLGEN